MPVEGMVCEGDLEPFQPWDSASRSEEVENERIRSLMRCWLR